MILVDAKTEVKGFLRSRTSAKDGAAKGLVMSKNMEFDGCIERVSAAAAIRSKERGLSTVFAYFSPKNKVKMTVYGYPAYGHLILSEGNYTISGYRPITLHESGTRLVRQAADVFFRNGEVETWVFSWAKPKRASLDFVEPVACLRWRHAEELAGKSVLIVNWIRLTAFMSAARGLSTARERIAMFEQMNKRGCVTIGELLALPAVDAGLMLSQVAAELASGSIFCELEKVPLTKATVLTGAS
ncbi:hypothetical protein QFZ99_001439 [Paraburkholderia atlantica]|uniref:hypothetical protein n=1 Tax=Paraburkholderia atlantica TaxID=2654982 RepID=UPI003D1CDB76